MPHCRRYFKLAAHEWTASDFSRHQRDLYYRSSAGKGFRHVKVLEENRSAHWAFERDRRNHTKLNAINGSHSVSTSMAVGKALSLGALAKDEGKEIQKGARSCNWHKHDEDAFPPLQSTAAASNAKSIYKRSAWADVSDSLSVYSDLEDCMPTDAVPLHAQSMNDGDQSLATASGVPDPQNRTARLDGAHRSSQETACIATMASGDKDRTTGALPELADKLNRAHNRLAAEDGTLEDFGHLQTFYIPSASGVLSERSISLEGEIDSLRIELQTSRSQLKQAVDVNSVLMNQLAIYENTLGRSFSYDGAFSCDGRQYGQYGLGFVSCDRISSDGSLHQSCDGFSSFIPLRLVDGNQQFFGQELRDRSSCGPLPQQEHEGDHLALAEDSAPPHDSTQESLGDHINQLSVQIKDVNDLFKEHLIEVHGKFAAMQAQEEARAIKRAHLDALLEEHRSESMAMSWDDIEQLIKEEIKRNLFDQRILELSRNIQRLGQQDEMFTQRLSEVSQCLQVLSDTSEYLEENIDGHILGMIQDEFARLVGEHRFEHKQTEWRDEVRVALEGSGRILSSHFTEEIKRLGSDCAESLQAVQSNIEVFAETTNLVKTLASGFTALEKRVTMIGSASMSSRALSVTSSISRLQSRCPSVASFHADAGDDLEEYEFSDEENVQRSRSDADDPDDPWVSAAQIASTEHEENSATAEQAAILDYFGNLRGSVTALSPLDVLGICSADGGTFAPCLGHENKQTATVQIDEVEKKMSHSHKSYDSNPQAESRKEVDHTRNEIRKLLCENIPDEAVIHQAEDKLWNSSSDLSDYMMRSMLLAAQSSAFEDSDDEFATNFLQNLGNNPEKLRKIRRGGKGKKEKKEKKERKRLEKLRGCAESPSCAPSYETLEPCRPLGPLHSTPWLDQLNPQQKGIVASSSAASSHNDT